MARACWFVLGPGALNETEAKAVVKELELFASCRATATGGVVTLFRAQAKP